MTELFFGLVADWGVLIVAASAFASCLAVPIPTFAVMLAGGAFAAAGDLVLWQVLAAAYGGALAGDQTGYRIGRSGGALALARLERRPDRARLVARARRVVDRWGAWGVFFSTWAVAPLGPWVNLMAGAAGMGPWRFALWDALGEAIWVAAYVTLGYLFGSQLSVLTEVVANWAGVMTAGSVAALAGILLLRWGRHHGHGRHGDEGPDSGAP